MKINIKKSLSFLVLLIMIIVLLKPATTYARYPTNIEEMGLDIVNQGEIAVCARNEDETFNKSYTDRDLMESNVSTILVGQEVEFKVNLSILNIQENKLKDGDYFEIILPSDYFDFEPHEPKELKIYDSMDKKEEVIGSFEIINKTDLESSKLKIKLNDLATQKKYLRNIYVDVKGIATKTKNKEKDIQLGKRKLPKIEIISKNDNFEIFNNKNLLKDVWNEPNNILREPKPISVKIGIKNKLEERDLEEKQFKTNIKGVQDNTDNYKEFVLNDYKGEAKFEEITFKKAGIYKYKVFETKGKDKKIKYDGTVFELEFNVELKEDNTLVLSVIENKVGKKLQLEHTDKQISLEFENHSTGVEIKGDKNTQSIPL